MDIAALSTRMSQVQFRHQASTSVLKMAMDTVEEAGAGMMDILLGATEGAINPEEIPTNVVSSGGHIDMYI